MIDLCKGNLFALMLAAAAATGCGQGGEPAHSGDGGADTGMDSGTPDVINVVEREEPGLQPSCEKPGLCPADYEQFIVLAAAHARKTSAVRIAASLDKIENGSVPLVPDPLSPADLLAAITDNLNIGFLMDGLDARQLTVITTGRRQGAGYEERSLTFRDPWVGEFWGILLVPDGPGPHPAVVAVHGHNDNAVIYSDEYHGAEYPGRGYAILMLTMRSMGGELQALAEHEMALKLMLEGFNLIGLRVYESLLGLKYLRYLEAVDDRRIGLIGHSGGSSTGNLTVRLGAGFSAYVSDYHVDYTARIKGLEIYHCETVPALYPYSALINDFATSQTPVKPVPYKYTNGMDEIFDFFDTHLKSR